MSDEPKPLTDEDLATLEDGLLREAFEAGPQERPFVSAALALRLVSAVRRLRSDKWLQDALGEALPGVTAADGAKRTVVLALLRKHRDGKA